MRTIGQRIRAKRKELKMTQKEVAAAIGVSASTITQYEGDLIVPKAQPTTLLCRLFGCSYEWLHEGIEDTGIPKTGISLSDAIMLSRRLPVLSTVQAGAWNDTGDPFPVDDVSEWVPVDNNYSRSSFALKVRGASMEGKSSDKFIPDGSIVTVETTFDPANLNGEVVVAMLEGTSEATIKEFQVDGPNKYLVPWNDRYDVIRVNGNCRIVGYVKDVIIRLGKGR